MSYSIYQPYASSYGVSATQYQRNRPTPSVGGVNSYKNVLASGPTTDKGACGGATGCNCDNKNQDNSAFALGVAAIAVSVGALWISNKK